ncbi:MAG: TetR/AcrR family transcriptional regulator C-terminal domain-containing protein [Deltaproteobacteria bacterium]|nr:TetR/AcrR family transcriptional regulator C-terminal domain-containing protein [Deltaproteobacteria bacterium]
MTVRKRKPAPEGLSHDAICAAALKLIDRDGLAAFSTRKLGRALGCEAMAIYWYYASKEDLLDAVVDRLVAGVGRLAAAPTDDWVGVLRAVAHAYRRLAHEHPKAFPLLATRRFATDGTYAFMERVFELARARGIDDRTTARFYRVVSSYVNGFALHELAANPRSAQLRKRHARVAAVSAYLEPDHLDEIFAFGLEIQLAALVEATHGRA